MSGYIYGLVDPRAPEQVRYVGLTIRPLFKRLRGHISQAQTGRDAPVSRWIRELLTEGIKPLIIELEFVSTEDDLVRAERYWIERFSSPELLNRSNAKSGYRKIRAALKGRKVPHVSARLKGSSRPDIAASWAKPGSPEYLARCQRISEMTKVAMNSFSDEKKAEMARKRYASTDFSKRIFGRYKCAECNREMYPSNLGRHQKASGHSGRIQISPSSKDLREGSWPVAS